MTQNDSSSSWWPLSGSVWGQSHWKKVDYELTSSSGRPCRWRGILDDSTGLIYQGDDRLVLRFKAIWTAAYTVPYLIEAIGYHLVRILFITVYLAGRVFWDYAVQREASFGKIVLARMKELGGEGKRSILNILRAPLYALAFFLSALYAILDPYNGRKMVAAYEYAWNHCIPLSKAIHLLVPKKEWSFHFLGKENAYYVPGCFQPVAQIKPGQEGIFKPYTEETWSDSKISREPRPAALCCIFI